MSIIDMIRAPEDVYIKQVDGYTNNLNHKDQNGFEPGLAVDQRTVLNSPEWCLNQLCLQSQEYGWYDL